MNKFMVIALSAAFVAGGLTTAAQASVLVSDSFSYPDGDLAGNTPDPTNGGVGGGPGIGGTWNVHSPNPASGATLNVSNGAAIVNDAGGVQDDNIPFAGGFSAGAGDILSSQFDVSVANPGAAVTPAYFGMFLESTSHFGSRIWVTTASDPTDTSHYRIAMTNGSKLPATSGSGAYSGDLDFGTTYTVGSTYDYTNASGDLWVVPVGQAIDFGTGGTAATDTGFSDAMDAYAFRQTGGNTVMTVDNLIVGTVPEPASLGVLAAAAVLGIRRRRSSVA